MIIRSLTKKSDITPSGRIYWSPLYTHTPPVNSGGQSTLEITKEDVEYMGLTTDPTDLGSEKKTEDIQDTQDCDRHNKLNCDMHDCRDRGVQPPFDDLDNKTHWVVFLLRERKRRW